MLEHSLFESEGRTKTRKPMTVVLSVVAHVVTISLLVLIPLLQIQALPVPPVDMSLWIPRIEPPKSMPVFSAQPRVQKYTRPDPNLLTEPTAIPQQIRYVDEPPNPPGGFAPSTGDTGLSSLLSTFVNRQPEVEAPSLAQPPIPPPPVLVKTAPTRISHLEQADLIHRNRRGFKASWYWRLRSTRTEQLKVCGLFQATRCCLKQRWTRSSNGGIARWC